MSSSRWYSSSTYHSWWKGKDTIWIYRRFQIEAINLIPQKIADIQNRSFAKDIYIFLTTERSSNLVDYHVQAIEKKFNNFDYAEADLIVLNADDDEHIQYNGQLENGNEEDIVSKSTVVSLWECYLNQCF